MKTGKKVKVVSHPVFEGHEGVIQGYWPVYEGGGIVKYYLIDFDIFKKQLISEKNLTLIS